MKKFFTMVLLLLFLGMMPEEACGRSVRAYFNGQEATVAGVVLHPGEPFTVDLYVTPDEESDVCAEIDEPGTVRAYDRISGDDLVPMAFKSCNASSSVHFSWVLAANGQWVDGTAPVSIYYQINRRSSSEILASGYFTVVDAYVAHGAIAPAMPTATEGMAIEKAGQAPGPGAIIALASFLAAALLRRI